MNFTGAEIWVRIVGVYFFWDIPLRVIFSYRFISTHIFTGVCFPRTHKFHQQNFHNLKNICINVIIGFQYVLCCRTESAYPFIPTRGNVYEKLNYSL